jgi:hypothetical protein
MTVPKHSHTVHVLVCGSYPHGQQQHVSLEISGDGGLDHMLDTFRAALVAAGFSTEVASRLDILESSE